MIWLELRNGNQKLKPGWNFGESAWAPIRKGDGSKWPFWYLLNSVSKDDVVFHLRNIKEDKRFVGYSIAASDGYITNDMPTNEPHEWDFSKSFYKVDLNNFEEFNPTIPLEEFFQINEITLRVFFNQNKLNRLNKKHLFYVIQNEKLQCLNGAYFSEFVNPLNEFLLLSIDSGVRNLINCSASTGEIYKRLKQRIGHQEFSENVKRNFQYQCCFPNCEIEGKGFLASGHIARWVDNKDLRGETANGLCFCLIHDKAFENGFFTLDENYSVKIITANIKGYQWILKHLKLAENLQIKPRAINPSRDCLSEHWKRVGYIPKYNSEVL